jgi:DNA/RNA-binding domain of Phe-tRNA-synthetase-like protein
MDLGLRAGAILFRGLHVAAASPALRAEIANEGKVIAADLASGPGLRSLPEIMAFRAILRKVGVDPRREQPTVERLHAYLRKRGNLPAITNLVDAYNLVSVRWRCSLGAHDIDTLSLPVALRLLEGTEAFVPLGADTPEPLHAGEYGYVDAVGRVLCRLDLRQADVSKITNQTRNALLIIEGTTAHGSALLRRAFEQATDLVTRHCGGVVETVVFPEF